MTSEKTRAMRVEVLAIGDELLDGRVADTNTLRFASLLAEVDLVVAQRTTVTDDIDAIVREARAAISRGTQLCLVSGGLGPTSDDVTAEAFATLVDQPLVRDAAQAEIIQKRLESRGHAVTDNQLKQADRPRAAELLANSVGTAPGFALTHQSCRFVSVPGVPREFDVMVASSVIDPLRAERPANQKAVVRTFGVIEAQVEARLEGIFEKWPTLRLGYRAHFPEIHVSLMLDADNRDELERVVAWVKGQLGDNVFAEGTGPFAETLVQRLSERNESVAIAESCTGGLVGDLVTDVPGASDVLSSSVVCYSNAAKVEFTGISQATIDEHGAVSEATVLAMARGLRARSGTAWSVAVSGIAGPSGGTADKPVGTVWCAVVGEKAEETRCFQFNHGRRRNKVLSAYAALDMLRRCLK